MFPDIGEDGVGFGDFSWGLPLSTGRHRDPSRFSTADLLLPGQHILGISLRTQRLDGFLRRQAGEGRGRAPSRIA